VPAFLCALAMREPPTNQQPRTQHQVREALENILGGARFVFSSPRVRWLMLCAVLFDSLVRLFLTFASNYYRLIGLPEFVNGFLGSLYALLGFLAAVLAQRMISHLKPAMIFTTLGILVFAPLVGLCFATPIWGLWVVIPIGLSMPMMQYFVSSYLNEWTESKLRATVLSFRGVALNIGYAFAGIGFVAVASSIRATGIDISETAVFAKTLLALPIAFALGSLMLMLAACGKRKAPIEN